MCDVAGRLEEQKGVDVLLEALPQILGGGSQAQVVVLGTGKKALEQKVAQMESQFPSSAKGVVEFNGMCRLVQHYVTLQAAPSCKTLQVFNAVYTIPGVALHVGKCVVSMYPPCHSLQLFCSSACRSAGAPDHGGLRLHAGAEPLRAVRPDPDARHAVWHRPRRRLHRRPGGHREGEKSHHQNCVVDGRLAHV
jgi:hypothetical protein